MRAAAQITLTAAEKGKLDKRATARSVPVRLSVPLPDETAILYFRHLLERHELGEALFAEINRHLAAQGLRPREGTIVDAAIIAAPLSTKNRAGARDPEMRQTKKGNQWHFGMKAHIGVDARTGLVHSLAATSANVQDVTQAHRLLHGGETAAWGDAGYQGVHRREEHKGSRVQWRVAMRPGSRRRLDPDSLEAREERRKASVRARAEHPFLHFPPASAFRAHLVERFFALLTQKRLRRGVFTSLPDLERRLQACLRACNENPRPLVWT